ncbi:MAG: 3-deoxy-manno-octulosonate cytidylyltransferase, partial [Deltaproteobacteria bacterium]|nr:3-deoxy-manno-octulosonate cytidylyltransferase [Deltaproteobacteria bacterium]
MIQRVYERATKARLVSAVAVATDDERIYKAVLGFGGTAVMTSVAHQSGTDRVSEAVSILGLGNAVDVVVNMQGDEPLIEPAAIDAAIAPLIADETIQVSTLKTRISSQEDYNNPNVVKVVCDSSGYALYFSRSQVPYARNPCVIYKHIGLYVYRRGFLERFHSIQPSLLEEAEGLEQLRALEAGVRIKVVETQYCPVSVDTPEDLEKVRGIFKS